MGNSVLLQIENGIGIITLNEPESRNALTPNLKRELKNALEQVSNNEEVKTAIITATGKAFCAGGNLKAMQEKRPSHEVKKDMDETNKIITMIQTIEKPIISAVNGYASGAGFSIALASDLVIAEKDAKFSLAFKNVGLVPDLGSHYFLTHRLGPWIAKELIFKAKVILAEEGKAYGFVNEVAPTGEGREVAKKLAREFVNGPGLAYAFTKSIVNKALSSSLDEIMELESVAQTLLRGTEDHQEGVSAFFEKRSPNFK